ncbi:MAG: hypothetical protein ACLUD8_06890 [Clostridium sp.]
MYRPGGRKKEERKFPAPQLQRKEKIEEERGRVSSGFKQNKEKEEGKFFSDLASEKRENRGRKRKSFR